MRWFFYVAGFWLVLVIIAIVASRVDAESGAYNTSELSALQVTVLDTESWKISLKEISDYVPKVDQEALADAERLRLEAEAAAQKTLQLTAAKLKGTVLTTPKKALLLLPKTTELTEMSVGDEWLTPWKLHAINQDHVVWYNVNTEELTIQRLFE